jgi:hypothetical protein
MGMAEQKPKVIADFENLISRAIELREKSAELALEGMKLLACQLHDLNLGISQLIENAEPSEDEDD